MAAVTDQIPSVVREVVVLRRLAKDVAAACASMPLEKERAALEESLIKGSVIARDTYTCMGPGHIKGYSRPRWWRGKSFGERGVSFVIPSIVIGSHKDAQKGSFLREIGVTHILNSAKDIPVYLSADFICHHLLLDDDDKTVFDEDVNDAMAFLRRVEAVNGRCLVHCKAGVSRATSIVIIFLMQAHGIDLRDAYDYIRFVRSYAAPNDGFKFQLARLELQLFSSTSVAKHPDWNFFAWNSIKHQFPSSEDRSNRLCCTIN